ncbi:MAG: hypothetical protein A2Z49_06395 [Chloroflexi bacterium RBG_19FT_COMBO_56_12]|nr:MAG: hypothetical protein A2W36_04720 [Chloroflexi bacterium RBG_16_58_14]OGO72815.1 MAG: hypothetical protein A2Z49_06395 [Chloroflexi bacterium RBG_19FT_COMBO_56_12]
MAFTDMDESNDEIGEQPPEGDEGGSNRTFIIIAAVLGGITLLALLCTAIYAFVYLPRARADRQNAAATAYAQETMLAYESTQAALPPTATNTKQPEAVKATPTPVLAEEEAVNTATPTINSVQATQDALDTVVAAAQTQNPTATKLPTSGFADDVGAPGLLAMAVILVVVIFLVRRLRTS